MIILSYTTKLNFQTEADQQAVVNFLAMERNIFNWCSERHYGSSRNSIVELHAKCYKTAKHSFPNAKSQLIIKAENNCLSAYRSAKSNRHKLTKPIRKKKLGTAIDQRLYSWNGSEFRLTTLGKRVIATPILYDRLRDAISRSTKLCDPTLFIRDGSVFINFVLELPTTSEIKPKLVTGVDLGIRRAAVTSEGKIFVDKKFNANKRKLRYLKRILNSKNTKSAKRHLKKIRNRERNINKNFVHHLTKAVIQSTNANVIAMENLDAKGLKAKKHFAQKKNCISQVSFAEIRRVLTYKAELANKRVVCVNPAYTSQTDHVTGRIEGRRQGCRFYSTNHGIVYDSDTNAAVNIAKLSKLPVSCKNVLDGQAVVSTPIVP